MRSDIGHTKPETDYRQVCQLLHCDHWVSEENKGPFLHLLGDQGFRQIVEFVVEYKD